MESEKKSSKAVKVAGIILLFFVVLISTALIIPASKPGFSFIKANHPIDMTRDSKGTWAYYYVGGEPQKLADSARAELLSKGYAEDLTNKPWFHFVKGEKEVIICNHNEIACNSYPGLFSANVVHGRDPYGGSKRPSYIPDQSKTAVVWVRSRSSSDLELAGFQVKKLVQGW